MMLPFASAREVASLLANGKIGAKELLADTIARITRFDPQVNAVVVRDFDRARAMAELADAALLRGESRPLLGVPLTVKESFNVAGLPTSWGVPAFRDWRPSTDSLAIQRLKHAGAIIVGKTNVSEGLADWQCGNEIFGRSNNPWDLERTPGGSSGGSAAALAAGFSFLELGSDVAGSIRIPAHFCGVFGHRPTYGLLSAEGYAFPSTFATSDLSTIGPLARTAGDLMLALELLAGPGTAESLAYSVTLPKARHERLQEYRVLLLENHPLVPSSQEVRLPITRLAAELRNLGLTVGTASPLLPDLAEATRICLRLLIPLTLSRVSEQQYRQTAERAKALSPEDSSLAAVGLRAGVGAHRDWIQANEARTRLGLRWRRLFRDWDVVVCPVSPTVSFPHDETPAESRTLDVDGTRIRYFDQIAWSSLATACGLPATTVPFGRTADELPTAVQIIGPYLEDRTTIAFAEHLERYFGGFVPPAAFGPC